MSRDEIIRMAREAGIPVGITGGNPSSVEIERFAALVSDAEAKRIHDEGMVTVGHMREQIDAEREACAKAAGWLWQQFQDTKDAHERNTMEPFKCGQFGFDQSTVQQSKRMMDAIRARGQA